MLLERHLATNTCDKWLFIERSWMPLTQDCPHTLIASLQDFRKEFFFSFLWICWELNLRSSTCKTPALTCSYTAFCFLSELFSIKIRTLLWCNRVAEIWNGNIWGSTTEHQRNILNSSLLLPFRVLQPIYGMLGNTVGLLFLCCIWMTN